MPIKLFCSGCGKPIRTGSIMKVTSIVELKGLSCGPMWGSLEFMENALYYHEKCFKEGTTATDPRYELVAISIKQLNKWKESVVSKLNAVLKDNPNEEDIGVLVAKTLEK